MSTAAGWLLHGASAVILGLLAAGEAHAQAIETLGETTRGAGSLLEFRGGITRSDNVARTPTDEDDANLYSVGLTVNTGHVSRRIDASLVGDLEWVKYPSDTFDDDVFGSIDGNASITLVEDRLSWSFEDTYGQVRNDPFGVDTPANLENANYFTTGPDFMMQVGDATSMLASGRYSTTSGEAGELNGDRYLGSLALERQLGSRSTASLIASNERFEFDEALVDADYDRREAYFQYAITGSRTEIEASAGYTMIDTVEDSGGLLARASISRRTSPSTMLNLSVGTGFTDAVNQLRVNSGAEDGAIPGRDSVLITRDPFKSRYATLGWSFTRSRTSAGLGVSYDEESHETAATFDRTRLDYGAYFRRRLSPIMELVTFAHFANDDFDEVSFSDDNLRVGAGVSFAVGRTIRVHLQHLYWKRDSSRPEIDFKENRTSLFVSWAPIQDSRLNRRTNARPNRN